MKRILLTLILVATLATLFACGGGNNNNNNTNTAPGGLFVTGEDTPLPSVLAFNVTINSITLNNGSTSVTALSTPTTVDFARLLGLRTLLAFNSVAPGTYNSATITLASPSISYLDLSGNTPAVGTLTGFFAGNAQTATVTVALSRPVVVTQNGLSGLKMDFDLRQSLQVVAGQLTGQVDPHIDLKPVAPADDDAQITDLRGSLVSVNVAGNSFVLMRPHGRQITIITNNGTTFSPIGTSLATMATPAVVEVDGQVQNDGSILANSVEVVDTHRAFVAGRIISVNPTSGPAQTVTILVGEEVPDQTGVQVGMPLTVDISQVTDFDIRRVENWFTNFLFNSSTLVPGQRIGIGGSLDSTQSPAVFVPRRVVLRRQGVVGDLVQGSVVINSGNQGTFQIQNNNLLGYVLGTPLDVSTASSTRFFNVSGLAGLQAGGAMKVVTFGLMLKDPVSGKPRMYAHRVAVLP